MGVSGTAAARLEAIWRVVAAIPKGRVCTYGEVARLAGLPRGARQVGRALGLAPAALKLPWFRVLGAGGRIAIPKGTQGHAQQVRLLRAEGVTVRNSRVRLPDHGWTPDLDELLWGPP
jgi:methylated-DNA-protein-cysteine methyltransferase-like protein